jgi:hypothetical protein
MQAYLSQKLYQQMVIDEKKLSIVQEIGSKGGQKTTKSTKRRKCERRECERS